MAFLVALPQPHCTLPMRDRLEATGLQFSLHQALAKALWLWNTPQRSSPKKAETRSFNFPNPADFQIWPLLLSDFYNQSKGDQLRVDVQLLWGTYNSRIQNHHPQCGISSLAFQAITTIINLFLVFRKNRKQWWLAWNKTDNIESKGLGIPALTMHPSLHPQSSRWCLGQSKSFDHSKAPSHKAPPKPGIEPWANSSFPCGMQSLALGQVYKWMWIDSCPASFGEHPTNNFTCRYIPAKNVQKNVGLWLWTRSCCEKARLSAMRVEVRPERDPSCHAPLLAVEARLLLSSHFGRFQATNESRRIPMFAGKLWGVAILLMDEILHESGQLQKLVTNPFSPSAMVFHGIVTWCRNLGCKGLFFKRDFEALGFWDPVLLAHDPQGAPKAKSERGIFLTKS